MGQKVNPIGLRLGINRTWDSRWFARKDDYARLLHDDIRMRKMLKERLNQAGVSRIIIERPHKQCRVTIYAARPGVIIGKKGADIDKLRKDIAAMTDGDVSLNIVEVRKPETDAQLVAENIAQQLERRVAFRRAMKRSMQSATRLGAKGVRVEVAGRLGGAVVEPQHSDFPGHQFGRPSNVSKACRYRDFLGPVSPIGDDAAADRASDLLTP